MFYNTFSKSEAPKEISKLKAEGYAVQTEEIDNQITIYINEKN